MEIWKTIKEYPDYEASTTGYVRLKNNHDKIYGKNGKYDIYKYVTIKVSESKIVNKSIHRIVAKCFIPNIENKPHINHINGIKSDNRIENLEWCTQSENVKHAHDTGLIRKRQHPIKRFTISINETLNEFCETEAKKMGIAKAAYVAMCLKACKEMEEKKCDTK